jgi:sugar phosphate isomerase/epimerase
MTRKDFLMTVSGLAASAAFDATGAPAGAPQPKFKRGVTLYSYQEEYYTHAMTLEDCVAEVASMGAEGVELIAEEMVPNYPDPPERWVNHWFELMEKHRTIPACLDTFVDVFWGGHRNMSVQESVDTLVTQMKLANRLGFKVMRPTTGPVEDTAPAMIEKALPYAEQYDVRICPEIHAPILLKGKFIENYLDIITRTKTKHLGFNPDLGIFVKRLPRVFIDHSIRLGAHLEIARYLAAAYQQNTPMEERIATVEKMGGNQADRQLAMMGRAYGPVTNDPKDLLGILPYCYNLHGKFYEMTESLEEYSIPYADIFPVLIAGGYSGYVNSEYEGQRNTQDAFETDSCEQVRRHHVMMKRLMGEA